MVKKWDLIYELRSDRKHVQRVQEASAANASYGLSTTPYLLGSKEWWEAIDAGSIERRRLEGTITDAQPASMTDVPEFQMRTEDGDELTGTRHGDPTRYVKGLRLRLDYVTNRPSLRSTERGRHARGNKADRGANRRTHRGASTTTFGRGRRIKLGHYPHLGISCSGGVCFRRARVGVSR